MNLSKRVFEITEPELRYAKQLGVNHIIGYLPKGDWGFLEFVQLRKFVESYELNLSAIGSPPPSLMKEIMHASNRRDESIGELCIFIRDMGKAGIPVLAYTFNLLGQSWRWRAGLSGGGRGDAGVQSFDYDLVKDAPHSSLGEIAESEVWNRLEYFLERVAPVAEEAGVRLACHPDDPPVPALGGVARVQKSVSDLQRLINIVPSPSNGLLFCVGTVAEMGEDVIDAAQRFIEQKKVFIIHFRNIKLLPGDSLRFDETSIDEGDLDMVSLMRALHEMKYDGLIDPDHAPVHVGDSQWGRHRGFAYAIGYMKALQQHMG